MQEFYLFLFNTSLTQMNYLTISSLFPLEDLLDVKTKREQSTVDKPLPIQHSAPSIELWHKETRAFLDHILSYMTE